MAPTETSRAVVEEFFDRLASRDPERAAALFAEQVDFRCAGSSDVPWLGPWSSRAEMARFFATMFDSFDPEATKIDVESFLADGNDFVVMGQLSQRLRSNGVPFTSPFALHLTVEDELLTRYHVYEDSLAVADAVAGTPRTASV